MTAPRVQNRQVALYGGIALVAVGAYLVRDAYERRGVKRPWLASKLLP